MQLPTRPVVPGFHPDPSICRVGDVYYLVNSSFEYAPGLPIHRSTDLRHWEHVGNALDRPSQLVISGAKASGGVFAPTLRHHNGRFWLITTNLTDPERGQLLVTAEDAAGPWSEPIRIPVGGIDPDLSWDEEGNCYLTNAGFSENGPQGIVQVVIDPSSGAVLTESTQLWQGTGGKFPEGPHLYRIGDFWYQLIAEGGTERGHAATIARSTSPSGPFEPSPFNPLLTARGSDSPVQNAGHADLVSRPDGSWVLIFHGVRTRGTSPEWHVPGRETFASEIVWGDGWPRLGAAIEPEPSVTNEDLSGPDLPLSWIAPGRFPATALVRNGTGWQLSADGTGESVFIGRRQDRPYVTVRAEIDAVTGTGGLELRIDPRHAVRIAVSADHIRAVAQIGSIATTIGETLSTGAATVELSVEPSHGHPFSTEFGPDEIVARVVNRDGVIELGRLDGRYLSTEVAGGMTGRIVGLFAAAGRVGVASFRYLGADDAAAARFQEQPVDSVAHSGT